MAPADTAPLTERIVLRLLPAKLAAGAFSLFGILAVVLAFVLLVVVRLVL